MSILRYCVRGDVGIKYVYFLDNDEMLAAVAAKSYKRAEQMAILIRDGNDTLARRVAEAGNFVSCENKRALIDTVRISNVLFGIIRYSHGKGRSAVTEYLYIPEIFLYDSLYGECKISQSRRRK